MMLRPIDGLVRTASEHAVERITGLARARSCTGGTCDGRILAAWCSDLVEFGLTPSAVHKITECVPLIEITPLREVYLNIVTTFVAA